MSVHAISGKPGGGKTLYTVRMIVDELLHGTRVIVTNVALLIPELNDYFQREYPQRTVDVLGRVRLMDDDMTGKFWTYRPKGRDEWVRLPMLTKQEWSEGKKPSYNGIVDSGVVYVIDECHNFFNARAWAETGRDVLFYLSQHRKLGDTVIWVTQAVANVDKQFRSITQDYTYLRNLTKERMGLFKLPGLFIRKTYGEPATDNSQAMESGTFKLDVSGMASLYNTAAGVGIHDRVAADKHERRKGIHWLWFAIGVPVIIGLIVLFVPKLIAKWFSPEKSLKSAPIPVRQTARRQVQTDPEIVNQVQYAGEVTGGVTNELRRVGMVGFTSLPEVYHGMIMPRKLFTVVLTDGRKVRSGDGHLQYLTDEFAVVDGVTNWLVESHPSEVQMQPAVSVPYVDPTVRQVADSGPSVYVIPSHQTQFQRPSVRGLSGGGGYQNYQTQY